LGKFDTLRGTFSHASFRPGQEEITDHLIAGRNVLAVMPWDRASRCIIKCWR